MKTKLLFIGMLLWGVSMLGQDKFETKEIFLNKATASAKTKIGFVPNETAYDINMVYTDYLDDIKFNYYSDGTKKETGNLYNPKMLNVFFANNVGSYVSSSKDLSLQSFYAVLDANDNSFFFGGTTSFGTKYVTDRIANVFTAGVKASAKDNYASLFENGKATKGIGINLKYTHIFSGKIFFNDNHRTKLNCFRENYLKTKYTIDSQAISKDSKNISLDILKINSQLFKTFTTIVAINDNNENKYDKELEELKKDTTQIYNGLKKIVDGYIEQKYSNQGTGITQDPNDISLSLKCIDKETDKEFYSAVYDCIAEDEIKFITDNKIYSSFYDFWIAAELYVPVTKKEYYITDVITNPNYGITQYNDWKASITATFMWKWNSKKTLFTSFSGTAYNNNTIFTKDLSAYDFQTIQSQGATNQAIVDTQSVYVGKFQEFITTNLKGEVTFFLLKDKAGISLAYEKNIGNYKAENWKVGIPFSFKDSDGKPTVNLELQWKEINKSHFVGFGIGYVFGSFVK